MDVASILLATGATMLFIIAAHGVYSQNLVQIGFGVGFGSAALGLLMRNEGSSGDPLVAVGIALTVALLGAVFGVALRKAGYVSPM